jgi:cytochrome c-type biogenesis protein
VSLELSAIPLAWVAGMLSILSPCVWPLVPAVMSSAATSGRAGPWFLALGLAVSFAAGGTVLTFALLNLQLDPEFLRYIAAFLLLLIAAVLLIKPLGNWLTLRLSMLTARFNTGGVEASSSVGQFGGPGLVALCRANPGCGHRPGLAGPGQSSGHKVRDRHGTGKFPTHLRDDFLSAWLVGSGRMLT